MARRDSKAVQKLDQVVASLNSLSQVNQAMLEAIKNNEKTTKESGTGKTGRMGILNMVRGNKAIQKTVQVGNQTIVNAIRDSNKVQREALGRGVTLSRHLSSLSSNTGQMTNGLTGFSNQLGVEVDKFNAGIRTNVEATNRLGIFMKATGGDSKRMFRILRQNTIGMGLNSDREHKLSSAIVQLAQKFGMSADSIVNAIDGLSPNIVALGNLGIGPEVALATANLAAALGPNGQSMAENLANKLVSPGGLEFAAINNALTEREALLSGDTGALIAAARKIGVNFERQSKSFTGGDPNLDPLGMRAITDAFGSQAALSMRMTKALDENAKAAGLSTEAYLKNTIATKDNNDFINSWRNLVSIIFSPIAELMATSNSYALKLSDWLSKSSDITRQVVSGMAVLVTAIGTLASGRFLGKILGIGGGGSGGAGGLLGGLGRGAGKGAGGLLTGLARGLKAIGSPAAMKGAVTIGILAASLAISAFGFKQFAGVSWKDVGIGLGTLAVLGVIAVAMGAFASAVIPGAIAIAILSVALIPLGFAIRIAAPGLAELSNVLTAVSMVPIANLLLLGPALVGISAGLLSFTGASLLSRIGSLFGGDGPIQKIIQLGKAARDINKLNETIRVAEASESIRNSTIDTNRVKQATLERSVNRNKDTKQGNSELLRLLQKSHDAMADRVDQLIENTSLGNLIASKNKPPTPRPSILGAN